MQRSETIGKLAEALSKAQGKIMGAVKDSENPFFNSQYADLASGWDACREALSENGLSVIQSPAYDHATNVVSVETLLAHASGEWTLSQLSAVPVKEVKEYIDGVKTLKEVESRTPQAIGSCLTYLRRYSLFATVGIAPEDDDGNAGSGKPAMNTKEAQKEISDAKIAELKSKVSPVVNSETVSTPPPGKSAADFALEHPPVIKAEVVSVKEIVEVQGVIGQLSPVRKTKAKTDYHIVMVGEQEVYVFDSQWWPRLKSMEKYETAVRCEKKAVGDRVILTMIGFVGISEKKE